MACTKGHWVLVRRWSGNRVCLGGLCLTTAGLFTVSLWQAHMPWLALAPSLLLIGFGQGIFQVSYIDTVMARLPVSEHGVAGSLGNLTRTIGVVFGASVLTLVFSQLRAGQADDLAGYIAAFSGTFSLAAAAIGTFIVVTLLRPRIWLG
jgi:hypothetical protein